MARGKDVETTETKISKLSIPADEPRPTLCVEQGRYGTRRALSVPFRSCPSGQQTPSRLGTTVCVDKSQCGTERRVRTARTSIHSRGRLYWFCLVQRTGPRSDTNRVRTSVDSRF